MGRTSCCPIKGLAGVAVSASRPELSPQIAALRNILPDGLARAKLTKK